MQLFLLLTIALSTVARSSSGAKISYEDLRKVNGSCYPRDSCETPRAGDTPGIPPSYACSCDWSCSKLGTCCIDSPHRDTLAPAVKPTCRVVGDTDFSPGFYMVDRCSDDPAFSPVWRNLCEEEWNGEDNILKIAPVTSLFSSITYKNYFCLRCHETTDDLMFWNVELRSYHRGAGVVSVKGHLGVVYDLHDETWVAKDENGTSIPVSLLFKIPDGIRSLAMHCEPDMISCCSDLSSDAEAREACDSYTAVVYIVRDGEVLQYKNVHCALCSSESVENMVCEHSDISVFTAKKAFSFAHLLDINRSSGDRVGKVKKCEEGFLWDPYGQKCRKITCAIPGYTIKNGQCVPP